MDFEKISPHAPLGKFLRMPLRLIPPETQMPILRGKLQGKKWVVNAGRHGSWLGTYEYDKQNIFEQEVKLGNVVFDIGAQAGFYSLLASVLVGNQGKVFAFEPLPRNLSYLRTHLEINQIKNVTVLAVAVAQTSGIACFQESPSSYQGKLSSEGGLQVEAIGLDEWVALGKIPLPNLIKMDIEGAEAKALKGARQVLTQARPTLFLAIHGRSIYQQCTQLLKDLGYEFKILDWHGNGELPKNLELIAYHRSSEHQMLQRG